MNGAGRIEDVQTAVEAPVAAALSGTEKETLAAIDPDDFSKQGVNTATGKTQPTQDPVARPAPHRQLSQVPGAANSRPRFGSQ